MKHTYLSPFSTCAKALKGRAAALLPGTMGLLFTLLGATETQAQFRPAPVLFQEDVAARQAASQSPMLAALRQARPLTLDPTAVRAALAAAPLENQAGAAPLLFSLPLPNGTTEQFRVVESPVMEPGLAAQFPSIKTYSGVGVSDPTASVRLDVTPRGFHAQVLSGKGAVYIDPVSTTDQQHYLSFYHRDMQMQPFTCDVNESSTAQRNAGSTTSAQRVAGTTLRTFRLAVAATGEYTAFHGGTVAAGQAAIVTAVNRVVGVYEKELAVRLVLIANNSQLVYTDAATDPYTNNSGSTMLGQNQTNLTNLIGAANYDIGHVFSTGGGGVASLGVICRDNLKARGVTGLTSPIGDAFYIDYVAHEMGHQFGGNHTFNSPLGSCAGGNRSALHAYEPGSGTTIMAYAGICAADNVQLNSDPYFHVESYEEIQTVVSNATCGTTTATGNTPPSVELPASGKVLPINTPFKLTAVGSDADGDALTYNWEQFDRGAAATLVAAQISGQTIPLFRSFSPTTSPTRYFPRLTDIIANISTNVERLPTVTRPLNFRVTLRDEHNGAQGVVGGLNSSAIVSLSSTSAAGPFLVSMPNTAVSWTGGSSQPVTWDVAGTDANGVNCATVNIRLSTDGGLTYPTLLLANTPNDGSAAVTVPNVATTTARIMVEAADNYFFDISNANFSITPCERPVLGALTNLTVAADANQCSASVPFAVAVSGTPAPTVSYTIGNTPITSPYVFPVGTTPVTVTATSCGGTTTGSFTVTVQDRQAPTVLAAGFIVALEANGTRTIEAADVDYGSTDNCGVASMTLDKTRFTCANVGPNQVTLTVRDNAGNVTAQTVTVLVVDNTAPRILAAGFQVSLQNGTRTIEANDVDYGSTDNCGIASLRISPSTFTCANVGPNPVTLTVTDNSGNVSTQTVTVVVVGDATCTSAVAKAATNASGLAELNKLQVYPNPAKEQATFRFEAAQTGLAQVQVYNSLGQLVATLYEGIAQQGQVYERTFNGAGLTAGLYTCRFISAGKTVTQRLILSK
ncbi:T9SS type A sorting domain-containing protein [Hymenobacter sp. BT186]|uniref:T9SS type A sorting domain-containing protein n=1 Tax=Hymenobacter telluris TaxID=2816474 RepID=A0A939JCA4_9BACT|nr:zinc-dependent metalloprotease family protein [Hymenobacter telluris]MBO0357613.1 T9SS type A sorting domain-containing protein [Hymenobacter telluris]MBW3373639.1 T9SS type A sorting domain-containing protein [Hymenobacter norwichensis]